MRWRNDVREDTLLRSVATLWVLIGSFAAIAAGDSHPGYEVLRTHRFLPPDFDEDVFAELWTVWPEPERSEAEKAEPGERRRLTFSYYGLIPSPGDAEGSLPALGYIADGQGGWVMNCLACHGGKVAGQVIPGLPNSHFALQTLVEDVTRIKLQRGKQLAHLELGATQIPLSMTNGTTNSVVFGIVLGALRKPDMSVDLTRKAPALVHHDMDPPPLWNVKKKTSLYVDGFAPKTHRPLMQFILIPKNTPEMLSQWEDDFRKILAWMETTQTPKYPWKIDAASAARGKIVFETHCSRCHGTYGNDEYYEQRMVNIAEIGTDRLRFDSLSPEHRQWMKVGWLSRYGQDHVETEPQGYVAPPLDGVWASAPYFHNGSVPTLWHILHPDQRPRVWKRTEDGYDQKRVGLEVEELEAVPPSVKHPPHRRRYFDSALPGKSPAGHRFPDRLTEEEKQAVLEYLKTL